MFTYRISEIIFIYTIREIVLTNKIKENLYILYKLNSFYFSNIGIFTYLRWTTFHLLKKKILTFNK